MKSNNRAVLNSTIMFIEEAVNELDKCERNAHDDLGSIREALSLVIFDIETLLEEHK